MTPERWQQIDELFHAALACNPDSVPRFSQISAWATSVIGKFR